MQKVFNVAVDIGRKLPAPAFEVNTNDLKSVKLIITITNGQTLLNLTDTTVRIAIRKPDNHIIFQDCTVKDATNGQVEIILENQAYISAGTHTAEIMCYKGSEVVAVSGTFSYKSTKGIMNDEAVESKSEFTAITQKIEETKKLLEDVAESGVGVDEQARQDIQQVTTQLAEKATKQDIQQLSLTFKESYPTKVALETAYPNGDNANHVVLADNMIYTYKNGWVSTGIQAVGTGLTNGGVTREKIADGAVDSAKRTPLGNFAQVFFNTGGGCNLDTTNKTVTFTPNFRIAYGKKLWVFTTTQVVNLLPAATLQYLFFDTATSTFRVVQNGHESTISENELVIMTFSFADVNNYTPRSANAQFEFTVNGVRPIEKELGFNNFSMNTTYTKGLLTLVDEKEGSTINKRTLLEYNSDGTVKTVTTRIKGLTLVTTLNYENGEFTSISKSVIQGGL